MVIECPGPMSLENPSRARASELPSLLAAMHLLVALAGAQHRPSVLVRHSRRGSDERGPRRSAHPGYNAIPSTRSGSLSRCLRIRQRGSDLRRVPDLLRVVFIGHDLSGFIPASALHRAGPCFSSARADDRTRSGTPFCHARGGSVDPSSTRQPPAVRLTRSDLTIRRGARGWVGGCACGPWLGDRGGSERLPQVAALADQKRPTCFRMHRSAKSYALGREAMLYFAKRLLLLDLF